MSVSARQRSIEIYDKSFSLSFVEGMSQGLVSVSYPVGVAPEIIENGENGFIVNSQAEAVAVIGNILNDHALRQKLSEVAYQTSLRFKSDIIVEELLSLYSKMFKGYEPASQRSKQSP